MVGKYADHLPLYRQSEIYAREGVELDRTLLAQWVGNVSALLTPLTDALRAHVFAADVVHADDTPIPVLAPGRGKTKTGRLWTYVRDERPAAGEVAPAVWFAYTPDRKGEHPQQHLEDFTGILQADGYAGFSKIYDGGRVLEAACWAHVRRKFVDLHELHQSPVAAQALDRIGALYAIEQEIRGRPPDERRAVRQERSRPLLDDLNVGWTRRFKRSRRNPRRPKRSAMRFRWEALGRYCDDGRIEIDNNAAERALRCVALGRKNFLFAGSDAGGDEPRRSTVCWAPPNSTATIPKRFCARCSRASPNIRSPVSTSCCPGISARSTTSLTRNGATPELPPSARRLQRDSLFAVKTALGGRLRSKRMSRRMAATTERSILKKRSDSLQPRGPPRLRHRLLALRAFVFRSPFESFLRFTTNALHTQACPHHAVAQVRLVIGGVLDALR